MKEWRRKGGMEEYRGKRRRNIESYVRKKRRMKNAKRGQRMQRERVMSARSSIRKGKEGKR